MSAGEAAAEAAAAANANAAVEAAAAANAAVAAVATATATATDKSDNRKHTKRYRNTMAKTGTGVLDAGELKRLEMQERQTV
jgi:hypothetical protein